jgi:hypothetical protein
MCRRPTNSQLSDANSHPVFSSPDNPRGRIPSAHSITLEWVKHFGLEKEPFYPKDLAQVALLKGKRVKIPADKPVDMSLVPLDLTAEELRIGPSNLGEHYYGETMSTSKLHCRMSTLPET